MDDEFPGGEALPGANQETIGEIHSQLVHVDEAAKADIARDYKVCAHERRRICIIPGEPGRGGGRISARKARAGGTFFSQNFDDVILG